MYILCVCVCVCVCACTQSLQSHLTLCDPVDKWPTRLLCPWDFPGKNIEIGCHVLLQGIFLIRELNLDLLPLLALQVDSSLLSHQGKPLHIHIHANIHYFSDSSPFRLLQDTESSSLQSSGLCCLPIL